MIVFVGNSNGGASKKFSKNMYHNAIMSVTEHTANEQEFKCYKEIAYDLYLKYIQIGSEFEINIPYFLRERCKNTIDENTKKSFVGEASETESTSPYNNKKNLDSSYNVNSNDNNNNTTTNSIITSRTMGRSRDQTYIASVFDKRIYELLSLFDQCNKNNIILMRDSFLRFKKTKEFQRLTKFVYFNGRTSPLVPPV